MARRQERPRLSELEHAVMRVVWDAGSATADDVRKRLAGERELKESTVRTLLHRLEGKGYLEHSVDGRTYVYRPVVQPERLATQLVRSIVDRFCRGSVDRLLVGLVDERLLKPEQLRDLARRIEEAESSEQRPVEEEGRGGGRAKRRRTS